MHCKLCRQEAVYAPLKFCKEHFLAYYEKKVRTYFEGTMVRNARVLVAVSGGKDSSALADVLVRVKEDFGLELALFTIDLNIPDYSSKGLEVTKQLAERLSLPLIIHDLKTEKKIIPDFSGVEKPCGACGTIKRYLLNKVAVENGFDYLATGHNLDDEFYVAVHNLFHRSVDQLRRQEKILPPRKELKLAGRLKPLYYLTEKENRLYCLLREIPHDVDECPYSVDNPQVKFKEDFAFIERDEKRNLLKSLRELQQPAPVLEEGVEGGQLHACPSCGFPTTSKNDCTYCGLMHGMKARSSGRRRRQETHRN